MTAQMKSKSLVRTSVAVLLLGLTRAATAQPAAQLESTPDPGDAPGAASVPAQAAAPEPAAPERPVEPTAPAGVADSAERIAALEAAMKAQSTRVESLEESLSSLTTELADTEAAGDDRRLSAWGFFDLTYIRSFYDNSDALYATGTPRKWSFVSNGVNLYVKSEMTRSLSAMVETRLTYTPVGQPLTTATNVYIDGAFVRQNGEFVREERVSRSPYSYFQYRQNGIFIERAHFDWKPTDWFGIRAGRYLTPFGIWNEDHGSPVLLGIDNPNIINYSLVPIHQLGVQVHGNYLLTDELNAEYAVTISNGRGPIDEYMDLDNNKAVGVRAKLVYTSQDWVLRLGGYGYAGRYTNRDEAANVWLTPSLTLDSSRPAAFGSTSKVTTAYDELVGTADAMIQYKGLRVFGEFAQRRVIYDVAPPMHASVALLNGIPFGAPVYGASYTGQAYFGLIAYDIDLGAALADVRITPYLGADHISPDRTYPVTDMNQYRGGINAKPSPFVTMKLEAIRIVPQAKATASEGWLFGGQTAVSF